MSDGLNTNLNNSQGKSIIESEGFFNLRPSMQNKVIDTMLVVKERDGGLVGKLIGINPSNVTLNIVFCVIFLLFLFLLVEVGHSYYICNHIDKDLVKVIIPAITLSLGYIFGRGCT